MTTRHEVPRLRPRAGSEGSSQTAGFRIAMASPEIASFVKTGGLGDMLGSLPAALERLELRVILVMPAYHAVLQGTFPLEDTEVRFAVPISDRREEGVLLKTRTVRGIPVYLIRADRYFDREQLYFEQADIAGQGALISLRRLRQEFYSLPGDNDLFLERALKEAVHELGHTYGLDRCPDPTCVMHFSNSLRDTDLKGPNLCPVCQEKVSPKM